MIYKFSIALGLLLLVAEAQLQTYTAYFTGDTSDVVTTATGGICLMGGASEDDEAMKWFLRRANGGDILVLRTSGSDGYNNYMYSSLGIPVNSVETIVCNSSAASSEAYLHQKIAQAEAIWFAGGDQWDYVSYWRGTAVDSLINDGIVNRNMVVGGTSAGMAIQGQYYFSAENGTVTTTTALADPFDNNVTVDSTQFLNHSYLHNVVTDTHYDSPDRKGRHVVFLARMYHDYGIIAKGIACDEYTAVCIDTNGMASVYGQYPTYDDNAYFLQMNCELSDPSPENCSSGNALNWNRGGAAIKVYKVKGTATGSNEFNLNNWHTGTGGIWENWYVDNGTFQEQSGSVPECITFMDHLSSNRIQAYPNPASDRLIVTVPYDHLDRIEIALYNQLGQTVPVPMRLRTNDLVIDLSGLRPGVYNLLVYVNTSNQMQTKILIE